MNPVGAQTNTLERTLNIPWGSAGVSLIGSLVVPQTSEPPPLVVFAHGSGSSRFSPRNRYVASRLNDSGFATFLLDLLTAEEESVDARTAHFRFDVEMLGRRLHWVTRWLVRNAGDLGVTKSIGYFGASTGAAAALLAAASEPSLVQAIVSRGGRPDLAGEALPKVNIPTLLIVGGRDGLVIELNQIALERLRGQRRLRIIPGATHLFPEPGALEAVADLAVQWFETHILGRATPWNSEATHLPKAE